MAKDTPDVVSEAATQNGALCWRRNKATIEVLLITSRDTKRWVLPKGWPMVGLEPWEAAEIEAWEEAGVKGQISKDPLGVYGYHKAFKRRTIFIPCEVTVFSLKVKTVSRKFPEALSRSRRWVRASKAARLVDEPELAQVILRFAKQASLRSSPLAGA